MLFLRFLICSFYGAFFIATILNHFRFPFIDKLRSLDFLNLLPKWSFFAPTPGTSDFHLVYRSMNELGEITEFKEIILTDRNYLLSLFWNKKKRVKKALFDLVIDLSNTRYGDNVEHLQISFSYLALLNFVIGAREKNNVGKIQFAILKTDGFIGGNQPTLLFNSDFHAI